MHKNALCLPDCSVHSAWWVSAQMGDKQCFVMCRITAIAAGHNHTVALSVGGDLMVCGHNKHGALGLGDTLDRHLPTNVCSMPVNRRTVCCSH